MSQRRKLGIYWGLPDPRCGCYGCEMLRAIVAQRKRPN